MKQSSSGFVLYFDDLDVLRKKLDPQDALDVIAALSCFAQTGTQPQEGELSPAAAMAYEMMARRVSKSLMEYADKKAKTRRAARARWGDASESERMQTHADDADACRCMQEHSEDADASERMQAHADACKCMEQKRKEMNKEAVAGISNRSRARARGGDGDDGNSSRILSSSPGAVAENATTAPETPEDTPEIAELVAGIPRYQRACDLVQRYRLPDSDISRDAILEDFEAHGERAVEDALREASLSNSRPMLSVKYYRKVLDNSLARGKPPDAAGDGAPSLYETRDGKSYYDGMEIVWS